ncbi:MAG: TolC family protein [Bacteroidota bacterium]
MSRQITLIALFLSIGFGALQAQETWSLEKCIQYARQNNLTVKQSQYQISAADLDLSQARADRYPNVSAGVSGGLNFGRTIDPVTNDFIDSRIGFNSVSLDVGLLVYNGGRINNTIKQSKLNLEAAKLDAETSANDIGLLVASTYLNILLFEEQLENARFNLAQTTQQLEQTDKLIEAGSLPVNDRFDFVAQQALNEQNIIEAQNQITINYLTLKQLLELDPGTELKIQRPVVTIPSDADPAAFSVEEVFTTSLGIQPQIAAGEKRLQSAFLDEKIAQSGLLPSVRIFGSLSSNYSDQALDFTAQPDVQFGDVTESVLINGQPATITQQDVVLSASFPGRGYIDQLQDNFGQSVGIRIDIPIYSNSRNLINMERARVGALIQEVQNRQLRNTLKADVQRAIADAKASSEAMKAAERTVEASQVAFDNAQRRFEVGSINSLEFNTAQNTLQRAQVDLIRSKYQYLFNLKIVDFYMGRPIKLD